VKGATSVRPAAEFKVLAALVLLLTDALVAVLVWLAAYKLQGIWGRLTVIGWEGFPLQTAMVIGFFAVAVWIGLRSSIGLYPGYGLSAEERLRRHTYSVVGAFAAVSFAIVLDLRDIAPTFEFFDLYGDFPRLLLVLGFVGIGFVGILLLSPLVQSLARREMRRLGIWDSPVNDGPR
jgi:hypothetical protein